MGFYIQPNNADIEETIGELIADPNPTEKTHFYIETKDGKKSVFDRTIHEFLKEHDFIPVLYSKKRKYAIPQLMSLPPCTPLQEKKYFGNN